MMIILDFGSGNTCRNSWDIVTQMIGALAEIDHRRVCVIKWQLFNGAGENVPLNRHLFARAHEYAWNKGFKTTASVFDETSLAFLLRFDVPFVKLACNEKIYWLGDHVPEDIPVIKSVKSGADFNENCLACIPEYPAKMKDYEKGFSEEQLKAGISDHTENWKLYKKYEPAIYECHFALVDSEGLDAGPFERKPNQLKEIL